MGVKVDTTPIPTELYKQLCHLGIIDETGVRTGNIGRSNYASSGALIQPWSYILDHKLNYWEGDIIKRVTRTKAEPGISKAESRILDLNKIKHICDELIRQELTKQQNNNNEI